ncbi:hypothetical protein AG1IA_06516 [Rhizoctonia solani AG-1 IA]|uniref:Uncharacterized protein n=1 Tax=Thanatephorus cucumeris (strain AG1-IA) TaxID=983506 RepID=L8WRN9_THACA|nr:hypothetical protein AG1IA_06516 [Rhizoctonia solani AG-1 IA]
MESVEAAKLMLGRSGRSQQSFPCSLVLFFNEFHPLMPLLPAYDPVWPPTQLAWCLGPGGTPIRLLVLLDGPVFSFRLMGWIGFIEPIPSKCEYSKHSLCVNIASITPHLTTNPYVLINLNILV